MKLLCPFTLLLTLLWGTATAGEVQAKAPFLDLAKIFYSCPWIYSLLFLMSILSLSIWLYSLMTVRLSVLMPAKFIQNVRQLFSEGRYEEALKISQEEKTFAALVIKAGLASIKHGPQVMIEAMRSEGRRSGNFFWQRVTLLNEISVVAPMLGLLGTVMGLFLAFYQSDRSSESIAMIFDGLGVAVGTTVVGLIVSILSMIFYTTLKYRVVNLLTTVENESLSLVSLVGIAKP